MLSIFTAVRIIVALANQKAGNELITAVNNNTTAMQELQASYDALLAKLNADPGVAESNYGTGPEAFPNLNAITSPTYKL
jgi:hypothetical protein